MIVRMEAFFRRIGRLFSRSEWMVRLLNLSKSSGAEVAPGLVMIQIDGLGLTQYKRALQTGKMPLLASLANKEDYRTYRHYSGLPSNTPGVQGTLFYGVPACVPAFSFQDSVTGKIFNMFNPESALAVENRLKEKGEALLAGGSAYGNIFTGGAKEAHFCASSIGWGPFLRAVSPLGMPLTIILNLPIFIRTLVLIVIEFVLAAADLIRHVISGKNFWSEVLYIPLRAAVCVLLRDLIAMGAKIDIIRGLPVIHVNFAGYDEQAHHRGPTSGFAHWSLKGIDAAIMGIWKAAHHSKWRDYSIFIYSDHGQEEATPYSDEYGRSVQEAVAEVFKESALPDKWRVQFSLGAPHWRAQLLRNKSGVQRPADVSVQTNENKENGGAIVAALGALGHIYSPRVLSRDEKEEIALKLVESAKIPAVLSPTNNGKVLVWNQKGRFLFPDEADKLIRPQHPFFDEMKRDLTALCHHPDAGTFIILGLRGERKTLTFHGEQGSHAGPGEEETSGFALLPKGALPRFFTDTISTLDLRAAAFRAMGRKDAPSGPARMAGIPETRPSMLRIMTYNVHSCMGRDGKVSPNRIAGIIAKHDPDVIAIQELASNEQAHQAQAIAHKLSMTFHFHPSLSIKKGYRGNAIISKFPMRLVRNGSLPKLPRTPFLEPRGALWVEMDVYGQKIQVVNTHLSLSARERFIQMKALLGEEWLGHPACQGPVIFCGDFNALAKSRTLKGVGPALKNTCLDVAARSPLKTLPSFFPLGLVDHIFVGPGLETVKIQVPAAALERLSSDHLPLIVDVRVRVFPL